MSLDGTKSMEKVTSLLSVEVSMELEASGGFRVEI